MEKKLKAVTKSLAALVLFLLMGFGVQAQTFNTVPLPEIGDKTSGTTIELTSPENAIPIIRIELQTNYDYNNPVTVEDQLRVKFLMDAADLIMIRESVLRGVTEAYDKILVSSENWPGMVDETWKNDLFVLLSI